jgi:hypothetical protein
MLNKNGTQTKKILGRELLLRRDWAKLHAYELLAPRLRGLKPGTLEREFGRSLASSRIREPGITQKKENL